MEEGKGGEKEKGKRGEEGNGEEKRRKGRQNKAESLIRDRANSMPLLELFKRGEKRRERLEEDVGRREGEIFKRSSMLERSPVRQEEGGLKEILREVGDGFRDIKSEIREINEGREEMKEWMEEMRKRVVGLEKRVEVIEKGWGGAEKDEGGRGMDKGKGMKQVEIREKGDIKVLEERMRRLELEEEKRKRKEWKRNIIIKRVRVKKEGLEGLRREIEEILEGDEEGEWTFTGGKGGTVIDYVIGNEETRGKVVRMKVEDWVDSDHQPIRVYVKGGRREEGIGKRKGKERRGVWTEEGRKKFEEYVGERDGDWQGVEKKWRKMKRRVEGALERVEREEKKRGEKRRERLEEDVGRREGEIFKRSSMLERSPVRQEEGGLKEILREVGDGFRDIKSEIREINEGREEMKEWMEEMRKRVVGLEKRVEVIEKGWGGAEKDEGGRGMDKGKGMKQVEIREKGDIKVLEERMRRLELEEEKRKRKEWKRNIIIKRVRVKKEGLEGLRREIEEILEGVEEEWRKMKRRVEGALKRVEREEKKVRGGWLDGECRKMKREVREELKRWKKRGGEGVNYKEMRNRYREHCNEKRRKERDKWERELEEVRSEADVWKVVNKGRKKRKRIREGIEMREWE
ncbi:golgin subfamily A member 6-like protein 22 [Odontomachus brunneus]|uniref:golgin subfamily A member 6-like protein 22 n=1 Tax=Odontomachus brunneus TaxID=486640 RepID=UPI0013F1E455|nr:golgin subfamily A member 6-like protein 22 [Odontomachus brunneus]